MSNIQIKSIQVEQSTKNIIVTYIINDNSNFPTIRGLNVNNKNDWNFIDKHLELKPYREIAWKDKTRPE
ncbi:hypothetical protein CMU94_01960 [Elizabethkingia anophelis]|nr:hypothetical protein [Elizabethkingia anophelis]